MIDLLLELLKRYTIKDKNNYRHSMIKNFNSLIFEIDDHVMSTIQIITAVFVLELLIDFPAGIISDVLQIYFYRRKETVILPC